MVMSCDTSPTIDARQYHLKHHLPSMHGNVIWYITYHQCKIMSYDTSTIIDAWSCHLMQRLPSMHANIIWCLIMLYDASPTIVAWSCRIMHHLPCDASITFDFIWFIAYHRWMFISFVTSHTIDGCSCLVLYHLPSMHSHVMWCITYH